MSNAKQAWLRRIEGELAATRSFMERNRDDMGWHDSGQYDDKIDDLLAMKRWVSQSSAATKEALVAELRQHLDREGNRLLRIWLGDA